MPAIREALLNALIHRDYFNNTVQTQVKIFDDHIRFHNPGHLPEGVTIDMILKEHYSYHRNPKVAEIFYRAGFVERYGSGIEYAGRGVRVHHVPGLSNATDRASGGSLQPSAAPGCRFPPSPAARLGSP
ncbi:hypothetical protein MchiMG62_12660 [Methanoculleus chikugoensis]|uniref:ATP-dependent DNA helicase RecG C-terminal domain-containing protein n=1 Tax=Methanoculleus chikugoensis TaxID=118126 RepID=A0ABM7H654_9EURY|nr:hypothetical protein MchiMG62_12660 [Methanoculleus chikugoensis]